MVDTPRYEIRPCAPLAPRCKSVLVAWSLEPLAHHTQTVNLYASLTLPVGQAHAKHYRQVWSGGRLAPSEIQIRFAVRIALGCSQGRTASTCIDDRGVRTGSAASRSARARPPYLVRSIERWMCGPRRRSDEGRQTKAVRRPKSWLRHFLSVSPRKNGARTIERQWIRAAIRDPKAVFWWPSGSPT